MEGKESCVKIKRRKVLCGSSSMDHVKVLQEAQIDQANFHVRLTRIFVQSFAPPKCSLTLIFFSVLFLSFLLLSTLLLLSIPIPSLAFHFTLFVPLPPHLPYRCFSFSFSSFTTLPIISLSYFPFLLHILPFAFLSMPFPFHSFPSLSYLQANPLSFSCNVCVCCGIIGNWLKRTICPPLPLSEPPPLTTGPPVHYHCHRSFPLSVTTALVITIITTIISITTAIITFPSSRRECQLDSVPFSDSRAQTK